MTDYMEYLRTGERDSTSPDRRFDIISSLKGENERLKQTIEKTKEEDKIKEKDIKDIRHDLLSLKNIIRMALIGLVILAFNDWFSNVISKYIPERTTLKGKFVYFLSVFVIVVIILGLTIQNGGMLSLNE